MKSAPALLSLALGFVLAADAISRPASAEPAQSEARIIMAQADGGQRPSIFRYLFRRERPQPRFVPAPAPAPQQQARPQRQRQETRPRRQKERVERQTARPAAAAPAAREMQAVEKAENAKRILVVGDFMGGALAKGLTEAYADNPNAIVVDATNGSSGLVRDDFYDWPAELPAIVEAQKPDALVVMIGGNDRQPIAAPGGSQSVGTEGWRSAYGDRVAAFADALKATGKPVFWGSLVPVSSNQMSRDYSAFNSILREQLDGKGVSFVDFWNGFADEEGRFVANGPDVRGQNARLRTEDGINFTRSGQRKLAFFMEQELDGILGGDELPVAIELPEVPQIAAADSDVKPPINPAPGEPKPSQIGPMVDLEALGTPGTDMLSTAAAEAERGAASVVVLRRLGREDGAPPAGRADNYSWSKTLTP